MGRKIMRVSALVAVVTLVSAAAVVAASDGPQVDQPQATITFTHIEVRFRECEGQDGSYSENKVELTGTSEGDSRLTGAVEVEYWELVNFTVGSGPQRGEISIQDAATGTRKMGGEFDSAGPLDFTQGVISGRVHDSGSGSDEEALGSGSLIANWRIIYGANGSITAQIGGEAHDTSLPTALWSGRCEGPFQKDEADLPPPEAVTAQALVSWREPGR